MGKEKKYWSSSSLVNKHLHFYFEKNSNGAHWQNMSPATMKKHFLLALKNPATYEHYRDEIYDALLELEKKHNGNITNK